jgi:Anti-anti-sigma regulatory factor (antagonist of anti-sigma factor)
MANLTITQRRSGPVVILDLVGQIRLGQSNLNLHKTLRDLVHNGEMLVLLNLEEVSTIDSSGLGELIAGFATLEKAGGELKLLKLTERVSELMMITKLLTVFDVYDSETEAIASFTTPEKTTQPLDGNRIQKAKATSIL